MFDDDDESQRLLFLYGLFSLAIIVYRLIYARLRTLRPLPEPDVGCLVMLSTLKSLIHCSIHMGMNLNDGSKCNLFVLSTFDLRRGAYLFLNVPILGRWPIV